MSIFAAPPMSSDWSPSFPLGQRPTTSIGGEQDEMGLGMGYGRIQTSIVDQRPTSHHSGYSQPLQTSSYNVTNNRSPSSQFSGRDPGSVYQERSDDGLKSRGGLATEPAGQVTPRASTTASPAPKSPASEGGDQDDQDEDDYDDDEEMAGELGQDASHGNREKTAAERRAEKRKMKRFRLTHNQTRFLMSEFARQAHPDAGQRERLSGEIPGLSPRQVQVWFQNRRAKLKRLTTDDRERMMKSRALPEDFDMTQALHSPFAGNITSQFSATQAYSTPISSPSYPSAYDTGMLRHNPLSGLRREQEENAASSSGMPHGFSTFTPPGSVANSEHLSPVSPGDDRPPFMHTSFPQNPQNSNVYGARASSYSSQMQPHSQIPRLQLHDRVARSRAESLTSMASVGSSGSPLRASMSYAGNVDYGYSSAEEPGSSQTVTVNQDSRASSLENASYPQEPGFNYNLRGFQSSALSRPRPSGSSFPSGLDINSTYRPTYPFPMFSNQQPQPSTPHVSQSQSASNQIQSQGAAPTNRTPQPSHASIAYSAPLEGPSDFRLSNEPQPDIYNTAYPHAAAQNSLQTLNSTSTSAHTLEPESYYKSEPESRRTVGQSAVRSAISHSNLFSPPQLTPQQPHSSNTNFYQAAHLQHHQQQPMSQHHYHQAHSSYPQHQMIYSNPHSLPDTPITGDITTNTLKRRRQSNDVGGAADDGTLPFAGGRKRSFTLPTGYGSGSGAVAGPSDVEG